MKTNKISLNINKDESTLNDYLSCWQLFNSRPNKISIHCQYDYELTEKELDQWPVVNNFTEIIHFEIDNIINDKILRRVSEDIFLSYIIVDRNTELSSISDLIFYYKNVEDLQVVNKIIENLSQFELSEIEVDESKLNLVSLNHSGLELEHLDGDGFDTDNIEDYYSKHTWKNINKLIKKIKKSDCGLSIFYGDRGCGKSSAIKYLSSKLENTVMFIPNNLVDSTINSPEFSKFLRKFQRPIIVLDDCEMIFNEYFTKSNLISNNLIQLVDGLISDKLKINIITIFNLEDKNEIDHNLLDCNSLIDVVEFTELSTDESNQLSSILGYKTKYKSDTRLVDVVKDNKVDNKRRLGF